MRLQMLFSLVLLLSGGSAWAAITYPSAPIAVDYRVAPSAVRTVTITTNTGTGPGSLPAAIADARFGDRIVCVHGVTYTYQLSLIVPTGTLPNGPNENWVTIISDTAASLPADGTRVALSDASNMCIIQVPSLLNSSITSSVAAHHYRFVGIKFATTPLVFAGSIVSLPAPNAADYTTYAHHLSFEHSLFVPDYDGGMTTCIGIEGGDIRVADSIFRNCGASPGNGDTHAFTSTCGPGPFLIYNNDIEGMGELIFFGAGSLQCPPVTVWFEYGIPKNITIRRNYIHRFLSKKRDNASYVPQMDTASNGTTISSSGTQVTFSGSVSCCVTTGYWIRNEATQQSLRLGSLVSGNTFNTVNYAGSPTAFSPPASTAQWRYMHTQQGTKNIIEFKAASKYLLDSNIFENGWADGQAIGGFQPTPREFGWASDIQVSWNQWISTLGFGFPNNDPSGCFAIGAIWGGFCPSPRQADRIWAHDNLFQNHNSTESKSITGSDFGAYFAAVSGPYGTTFEAVSASGTTGTVTLTSVDNVNSNGIFFSGDVTPVAHVAVCLNGGRGTLLSTSADHRTATMSVTTTLDPSCVTGGTGSSWALGPSAIVGTFLPAPDSWVFEHNTMVGPDSTYTWPTKMGQYFPPDPGPNKLTNFVMRDNIFYIGSQPGTGAGFGCLAPNNSGGAGVNYCYPIFVDAATGVFAKNVYFGPATTNSNYSTYGPAGNGSGTCPGGGCNNVAFNSPDQTGSGAGGSVGFTNYAASNYLLANGTQYKNWATDGKDPGVDINTLLNTKVNGVLTGGPEGTMSWTLTISTAGTGSGTTTGAGGYVDGSVVTMTATPNAGSSFGGWTGVGCTTGTVTMIANTSCTATFTLNSVTGLSIIGGTLKIGPGGTLKIVP